VHTLAASSTSSSETGARPLLELAVPCAAVVLSFVALAWVWRATLAANVDPLKVQVMVLQKLDGWRAQPPEQHRRDIVVLGDSLVSCPGLPVSAALETALAARDVESHVVQIAQRAFRALHFYSLADDVLAGEPWITVLAIDMRSFSSSFVFSHAMEFPAVTRRLSIRRSLAVADVLHEEGLTLLDPLIFRAEDAFGMLDVTAGVRAWAGGVFERDGDAIGDSLGIPGSPFAGRVVRYFYRFGTADEARADYLVDQAGSSGARVLRDLVAEFRRAGRPLVLYVSPVDTERLAALGVSDEIGLAARVRALRAAIGATRDQWLDLHAALPASDFRDRFNHLHDEGCAKVADAIAHRLAGR
jgi:hypothetical protein